MIVPLTGNERFTRYQRNRATRLFALAVVFRVSQFAPQSAKDSRFGLPNGIRREAEFGGDGGRVSLFDGAQPEGLPGAVFKLTADAIEGAAEKPLQLDAVRRVARVIGPVLRD